jgi:hypothetical protein
MNRYDSMERMMGEIAPATPNIKKGCGYDDYERQMLDDLGGASPVGRIDWKQMKGIGSEQSAAALSPESIMKELGDKQKNLEKAFEKMQRRHVRFKKHRKADAKQAKKQQRADRKQGGGAKEAAPASSPERFVHPLDDHVAFQGKAGGKAGSKDGKRQSSQPSDENDCKQANAGPEGADQAADYKHPLDDHFEFQPSESKDAQGDSNGAEDDEDEDEENEADEADVNMNMMKLTMNKMNQSIMSRLADSEDRLTEQRNQALGNMIGELDELNEECSYYDHQLDALLDYNNKGSAGCASPKSDDEVEVGRQGEVLVFDQFSQQLGQAHARMEKLLRLLDAEDMLDMAGDGPVTVVAKR